MKEETEMENKVTKETILRISGVNPRKCMRCGKCSGTCPSYDEMEYHPHQFVYMVENGEIEPLLKSKSKMCIRDRSISQPRLSPRRCIWVKFRSARIWPR